jgi:hypothetical protein
LRLYHANRDNKDYGICRFVQSEIEYLAILCRSIFDLLQELVRPHVARIHIPDGPQPRSLPSTFRDVVHKNKEAQSADEVTSRYHLPHPIAQWHIRHREFFMQLRSIRDRIVHDGSTIDLVFSTDRGFAVLRGNDPFNGMYKWPSKCELPNALARILDRDLLAAGISRRVEVAPGKWKIDKQDERGRTVDVHALRTTFGTPLSKAGVAPRTAQAAMRHSTINLTMNVYTDPKLLDVAGAVESLPALPLGAGLQREAVAVRATGTDDLLPSPLVPTLVPNSGKSRTLQSIVDKAASEAEKPGIIDTVAPSACVVNRKDPLTIAVNGSSEWAMRDSNPRHPRCKRGALAN